VIIKELHFPECTSSSKSEEKQIWKINEINLLNEINFEFFFFIPCKRLKWLI